jgi:hypothetical protein
MGIAMSTEQARFEMDTDEFADYLANHEARLSMRGSMDR